MARTWTGAKRLHRQVRKLCAAGSVEDYTKEWVDEFARFCVDDKLVCNNEACSKRTTTGVGGETRTVKMKVCSGCKQRHYCSRECQLADWAVRHSKVCKTL